MDSRGAKNSKSTKCELESDILDRETLDDLLSFKLSKMRLHLFPDGDKLKGTSGSVDVKLEEKSPLEKRLAFENRLQKNNRLWLIHLSYYRTNCSLLKVREDTLSPLQKTVKQAIRQSDIEEAKESIAEVKKVEETYKSAMRAAQPEYKKLLMDVFLKDFNDLRTLGNEQLDLLENAEEILEKVRKASKKIFADAHSKLHSDVEDLFPPRAPTTYSGSVYNIHTADLW